MGWLESTVNSLRRNSVLYKYGIENKRWYIYTRILPIKNDLKLASWQNFEYQVPEGNNGERELYHSIHFNYMLDVHVVYVFLYMG